jgi:hypothetical protein
MSFVLGVSCRRILMFGVMDFVQVGDWIRIRFSVHFGG